MVALATKAADVFVQSELLRNWLAEAHSLWACFLSLKE